MPSQHFVYRTYQQLRDDSLQYIEDILETHKKENTKIGTHRQAQFETIRSVLKKIQLIEGLNLKQQHETLQLVSRLQGDIEKLNKSIVEQSNLKKIEEEQKILLQENIAKKNELEKEREKLIKFSQHEQKDPEEVENAVKQIKKLNKKITKLKFHGVLTKEQDKLLLTLRNKRQRLVEQGNKGTAIILGHAEFKKEIKLSKEFKKEFNLSEEFKSQIITSFWLQLKNQIKQKEYSGLLNTGISKGISLFKKFVPDSWVQEYGPDRSNTYRGIDKLIGITDDNKMSEQDEKNALCAYQYFNNHFTMIDQLKEKQLANKKIEAKDYEEELQNLISKVNELKKEVVNTRGEQNEKLTKEIIDTNKQIDELNDKFNPVLQKIYSSIGGLKKTKTVELKHAYLLHVEEAEKMVEEWNRTHPKIASKVKPIHYEVDLSSNDEVQNKVQGTKTIYRAFQTNNKLKPEIENFSKDDLYVTTTLEHNTQPPINPEKKFAKLPNGEDAKNMLREDSDNPYDYFKGTETYPDQNNKTATLPVEQQGQRFAQAEHFRLFVQPELAKIDRKPLRHISDSEIKMSNQHALKV